MIPRRGTALFAGVIAGLAAIYFLRLDSVAGMMVDDAWYIVLAKSIAQGEGFRLISSATTQVLPTVPPGFPLLLAPMVAALPDFPGSVVWMKLLSIGAVLFAGVLCWRDFIRHRDLDAVAATMIVAAALATPALVFLATSTVMAEGIYIAVQVCAVIAIERITRQHERDVRSAAIAAIVTAAAMLIRSSAAAVIAAAVVYLVIARRWRQAAIFLAVLVACLLPWNLYAAAHAPSDQERAAHGGSIAYSYSQLIRSTRFSFSDPSQDVASTPLLLRRAFQNLTIVFTRDVGAAVVPELYRGPEESGQEVFSVGRPGMGDMGVARGTMFVSVLIALVIVVGWLSSPRERFAMPGLLLAATLPMIAPVVGQTFRYLVPLTPYLLLFFWRGLRSPAVARVVFLTVIGLQMMDHAGYIHQKLTASPEWIADARETDELVQWIANNVRPDQFIASTNPGLIYLGANRRTVAIDGMLGNWDRWKSEGVRFVACTEPGGELPPTSLGWKERFRSPHRGFWIVEMLDR